MTKLKYIRLTKLRESANPEFKAAKFDNFRMGQDNPGVSLPIHYWVEGVLLHDVAVGSPIVVDRAIRNGVKVGGLFRSSPVTAIKGGTATTLNSIYSISEVDKPT